MRRRRGDDADERREADEAPQLRHGGARSEPEMWIAAKRSCETNVRKHVIRGNDALSMQATLLLPDI